MRQSRHSTCRTADAPSVAEGHRAGQRDGGGLCPACGVQLVEQPRQRFRDEDVAGNFPKVPAWQFWFVNHVTTNSFFVPTQYGFADWRRAARPAHPEVDRLDELGRFADDPADQRRGSREGGRHRHHAGRLHLVHRAGGGRDERGHPGGQLQRRRTGQQDRRGPTSAPTGSAYVGQALYTSGQQLGQRIKSLIPTPGDVVIFIVTPGQGNIQPRYDGAASMLTPAGYTVPEIATTTARRAREQEGLPSRPQSMKGAFAVDSTRPRTSAQALSETGL